MGAAVEYLVVWTGGRHAYLTNKPDPQRPPPPTIPIACACGCGRKFTDPHPKRKWATGACADRDYRRRNPKATPRGRPRGPGAREADRARYRAHLASGRCAKCGRRRTRPGLTTCAVCFKAVRPVQRRYQARRKVERPARTCRCGCSLTVPGSESLHRVFATAACKVRFRKAKRYADRPVKTCGCGCGAPVPVTNPTGGRRLYLDRTHRSRAYWQRYPRGAGARL